MLNSLPYGAILAEIARRQKTALAGHPLQPVGGVVGMEGRSQLFFCFSIYYLAASDPCGMQASCHGQEAQLPCGM